MVMTKIVEFLSLLVCVAMGFVVIGFIIFFAPGGPLFWASAGMFFIPIPLIICIVSGVVAYICHKKLKQGIK